MIPNSLFPQNISIAVVGEDKALEIYDNEKVAPFVSVKHTLIVAHCDFTQTLIVAHFDFTQTLIVAH